MCQTIEKNQLHILFLLFEALPTVNMKIPQIPEQILDIITISLNNCSLLDLTLSWVFSIYRHL